MHPAALPNGPTALPARRGCSSADWRERTILQWRIMRKRALQQTLERLTAALGRDGHEAAADAAAAGDEAAEDAAAAAAGAAQQEESNSELGEEAEQIEAVHEEL